jgi:hypothetical protein
MYFSVFSISDVYCVNVLPLFFYYSFNLCRSFLAIRNKDQDKYLIQETGISDISVMDYFINAFPVSC